MGIVWRTQLSVHNELIDREHRQLIDLINAVEEALATEQNGEALVDTLDRLVSYTEVHFCHEERIQEKIGYPLLADHRQQHRELVDSLMEIRRNVLRAYEHGEARRDATGDNVEASADTEATSSTAVLDKEPLVLLLRGWLLDHIIGNDLKMKPYLLRQPSELS